MKAHGAPSGCTGIRARESASAARSDKVLVGARRRRRQPAGRGTVERPEALPRAQRVAEGREKQRGRTSARSNEFRALAVGSAARLAPEIARAGFRREDQPNSTWPVAASGLLFFFA